MTVNQQCPEEPNREMPGHVYVVPDKNWGFEAVGRDDHPGICIDCNEKQRKVRLCKGRDFETLNPKYRASYMVILSDDENGLKKDTAFQQKLTEFRLRKVLLYYKGEKPRYIGTINKNDFQYLLNFVNRAIPND